MHILLQLSITEGRYGFIQMCTMKYLNDRSIYIELMKERPMLKKLKAIMVSARFITYVLSAAESAGAIICYDSARMRGGRINAYAKADESSTIRNSMW